MAAGSDKHRQPGRQSPSPQLLKPSECPQTWAKTAGAKWSREDGQGSNSLVERQRTGLQSGKHGERCSGLCITTQIDCKQLPNLSAVQNKPELIKAGRTSERNTTVTINKYLLQSHVQKSCLLFCKSAC